MKSRLIVVGAYAALLWLPRPESTASTPQIGRDPAPATPFTVRAVPEGPLSPFGKYFSKYLNVFGVHIFATRSTPDNKLRHVAAVMAEYLDNNEDGKPDNPKVLDALASRDAYLVMTANEREFDRVDPETWHAHGFQAGQFQHAEETRPSGNRFDATLEEVLHLITVHGYGNAYPRVFGLRSGTPLARCLDTARGGHFTRVPRRYPKRSWFHYDDRTCDYACQMTEYFYWCLTSILGAQAAPWRQREVADEWELPTRQLVRQRDPMIFQLLTNPKFRFPTRLPDGKYEPRRNH